jgi:gliding motility-associated-like protein
VVTDASPLSGPSNGTVTLIADGSFTYTPDTGFVGTDSFVYSIVDSGAPQATDTATVYIYVDEEVCTAFDVELAIVDVLCFGETTGSIDLMIASGAAPFTFLWSNEATTEDITDLVAGTYTVDITDANGCVTTVSATVSQPDAPLSVTISAENGIATAVTTGGSPPYTYLWSNGATTESITIPDGTYSVRVTDANGCEEEAIGTVGPCEDIEISTTITPNGDQFNEFFEVNFIGGGCNFAIDLKIVNRWGAIVYESNDYQNNWNGVAPDSSLGSAGSVPTGTYYYVIILRNSGLNPVSGPLYIGTK